MDCGELDHGAALDTAGGVEQGVSVDKVVTGGTAVSKPIQDAAAL